MNHARFFVDITYMDGFDYSGWVLRVWSRNPDQAEAFRLGSTIPPYSEIENLMDMMESSLEEARKSL